MELRALWKIVLRRWWLIALPSLAALAYAVYGLLQTPAAGGYATSIHFTASAPVDVESPSYEDTEYYPWLTSEYVVNGLTDWVKTSSFATEVAAVLAADGLELPVGILQANLSADNERSVMVVYASWHDADELAAIADAVAVVLREKSSDYFPQFGAGDVEVVQFDTVNIGAVPPPLSKRFDPIIRFGLGVAAGVALAFVVEYLDPTLRSRAEIEALGLSVLAEVPRK